MLLISTASRTTLHAPRYRLTLAARNGVMLEGAFLWLVWGDQHVYSHRKLEHEHMVEQLRCRLDGRVHPRVPWPSLPPFPGWASSRLQLHKITVPYVAPSVHSLEEAARKFRVGLLTGRQCYKIFTYPVALGPSMFR